MIITEDLVRKLVATVDAGLVAGVGVPVPGQMCVEAAICYALGELHSDGPSCVEPCVRKGKIILNDARWSSPQARAQGMRAVAIAQLGSKGVIDPIRYSTRLAELTIRVIVPRALRAIPQTEANRNAIERAAARCEQDGTQAAAAEAAEAAEAAARAAEAAARAAEAAARAAGAESDNILASMANLMVQTLQECGSPGCEWLWLLDDIPGPTMKGEA